MSYSFNAQAATKEELKEALSKQFKAVVESQGVHAADIPAAEAAALAHIDAVNIPEGVSRDYRLYVHGSIGWHDENGKRTITSVIQHCEVSLTAKAT